MDKLSGLLEYLTYLTSLLKMFGAPMSSFVKHQTLGAVAQDCRYS